MKEKKNVYIVILLIVVVVVWYMLDSIKIVPKSTTQFQSNEETIEIRPEFIFGTVTEVEGNKIFMKVDLQDKTVIVDENTDIIKKIKINGIYENKQANFDEIKPSMKILVSYTEISNSGYKANIVQILDL